MKSMRAGSLVRRFGLETLADAVGGIKLSNVAWTVPDRESTGLI